MPSSCGSPAGFFPRARPSSPACAPCFPPLALLPHLASRHSPSSPARSPLCFRTQNSPTTTKHPPQGPNHHIQGGISPLAQVAMNRMVHPHATAGGRPVFHQ
ncbi:hypothetical protein PVAP13_8NG278800 [Panicum virgatum]|uniref:Uncharacterized protein n=1 Tax=Panicum virgatum TaxID=38727 RepID=A0A8T0P8S7_PANVG|nr:hypothetical protein PVAP13_8NG278800 [Panicum virgatum]